MLTATIQPQPKPSETIFRDLFQPLKPVTDEKPGIAPGTTPNAPVPPSPDPGQLDGGGISNKEALSGIKHTEIPSFSASGNPGISPLGVSPSGSLVTLGGLIEGKWAVDIMDSLLPAAMVAALYTMGVKLRKSELQLTERERGTLAPIMQKCLDSILLNFDSPWTALAVTAAAIYGGKLMEKGVINWVDTKNEAKQAEALREQAAKADRDADPARHDIANQSAADIMAGKVAMPGQYPFGEEVIQSRMRESKSNRAKAVKFLCKKYGVEYKG